MKKKQLLAFYVCSIYVKSELAYLSFILLTSALQLKQLGPDSPVLLVQRRSICFSSSSAGYII